MVLRTLMLAFLLQVICVSGVFCNGFHYDMVTVVVGDPAFDVGAAYVHDVDDVVRIDVDVELVYAWFMLNFIALLSMFILLLLVRLLVMRFSGMMFMLRLMLLRALALVFLLASIWLLLLFRRALILMMLLMTALL